MTAGPLSRRRRGDGWSFRRALSALWSDLAAVWDDWSALIFPPMPRCPSCHSAFQGEGLQVLCLSCYDSLQLWETWRPLPLDGTLIESAAALGPYRGALRKAVHRIKFSADRRLGLALGYLMGSLALERPEVRDVAAVVPVPLHPRREWSRGFNQGALLAEGVARVLGRPVWATGLRRERDTRQQAALGEADRRENVRAAFRLSTADKEGKAPTIPLSVLLVDDVVTTGATLEAAAAALRAGGVARVYGLVLAAAERRERKGRIEGAADERSRRKVAVTRTVAGEGERCSGEGSGCDSSIVNCAGSCSRP